MIEEPMPVGELVEVVVAEGPEEPMLIDDESIELVVVPPPTTEGPEEEPTIEVVLIAEGPEESIEVVVVPTAEGSEEPTIEESIAELFNESGANVGGDSDDTSIAI